MSTARFAPGRLPTTSRLTWAQTAALNPRTAICLSCGADLAPTLARLASLRCHDCRDTHAPISPRVVQLPARRAA